MLGLVTRLFTVVGLAVLPGGSETGLSADPAPDPPPTPTWTGFIRRLVGESICSPLELQEPCLCSSEPLLRGAANPFAYLDRFVEVAGGREQLECSVLRTDSITVVLPQCPGEPEPLIVHGASATWLEWPQVPCSARFDGVRGDVAELHQTAAGVDLGTVVCLFDDRLGTDTSTLPDAQTPLPGQAFFLVVRNARGFAEAMTYGRSSAGRERRAPAGDCVPNS